MGSSASKQSSSALKYEYRTSWAGTDLNRCYSATGFKGCAWRPNDRGGTSRLCSYVSDEQSFPYYPGSGPAGQNVYSRGYTTTAPNDMYACPTEPNRYIEITVPSGLPPCMCEFMKIRNEYADATICYGNYGNERYISCGAALFRGTAWNVIKLDAQAPGGFDIGGVHVDETAVLFAGVGLAVAVAGVVMQRVLKARREKEQSSEDMTALYTLLDNDTAKRLA